MFYAVRKGKRPGIYDSWDDCKEQINGFSNPEFRKFSDIKDANVFMGGFQEVKQKEVRAVNEYFDGVLLYTDGACSGNPGPGGYGFIHIKDGVEKTGSGGYPNTTNNAMELEAVIQGLIDIQVRYGLNCNVKVITDSTYVEKAFNEGWLEKWIKNGWITTSGKVVANISFWEILIALKKTFKKVEFVHVYGHNGQKQNERCDKMAVAARMKAAKEK